MAPCFSLSLAFRRLTAPQPASRTEWFPSSRPRRASWHGGPFRLDIEILWLELDAFSLVHNFLNWFCIVENDKRKVLGVYSDFDDGAVLCKQCPQVLLAGITRKTTHKYLVRIWGIFWADDGSSFFGCVLRSTHVAFRTTSWLALRQSLGGRHRLWIREGRECEEPW